MTNEDFKRKFSDYQENEPQGLWDGILAGLDTAKAPAKPLQKRTRTAIIILAATFTAAAAIILGVFLRPQEDIIVPHELPGQLTADNSPTTGPVTVVEPSTDINHVTTITPTADVSTTSAETVTAKDMTAVNTHSGIQETLEEDVISVNSNPDESINDESAIQNTTVPDAVRDKQSANTAKDVEVSIYSEDFNYNTDENPTRTHSNKIYRRKRVSLGLLADGIFKSSYANAGYNESFDYSQPYSQGTVILNGLNVDPVKNIQNLNTDKEVTTRTRFTVPIRAGLAIRWKLSFGLGIETGLQYSYLNSITESGSAEHFSRTENICHFIGVPFNISYSFWGNEFLDVYANAGVLFELQTKSSSVTAFYINNEPFGNQIINDPKHSPIQMSATLSAGIQYNILRWLAIYAEPGATYFLDRNLYGEHPWNFSIRAGIRFDITGK